MATTPKFSAAGEQKPRCTMIRLINGQQSKICLPGVGNLKKQRAKNPEVDFTTVTTYGEHEPSRVDPPILSRHQQPSSPTPATAHPRHKQPSPFWASKCANKCAYCAPKIPPHFAVIKIYLYRKWLRMSPWKWAEKPGIGAPSILPNCGEPFDSCCCWLPMKS